MTDNSPSNTTALPPNPPEPHHIPGRKNRNKTIADVLAIAKRAYENTMNNPQIGEPMAAFGYDRRKMEILGALYADASKAHNTQVIENGEKTESYAIFKKYYEIIHNDFSRLRKIARIVFKREPAKLEKIVAAAVKKLSINGSMLQIKTCYENLLNSSDLLNAFAQHGITVEVINGYYSTFQEAERTYVAYKKELGEAQDSTESRDAKIDALYDFLSDFIGFAKIAFAEHPDLLIQIS